MTVCIYEPVGKVYYMDNHIYSNIYTFLAVDFVILLYVSSDLGEYIVVVMNIFRLSVKYVGTAIYT